MKKIVKMFLVAVFVFTCFNPSVFALEESNKYTGLTDKKPDYLGLNTMVPYGESVPKNVWNWSNGAYVMDANTSYTELYSNYYFTAVSKLNFVFTYAEEDITFEVYELNASLWFDKKVETFTIDRLTQDNVNNGITRKHTVSDLEEKSKYYIKVLPPAYFTATISA